MTLCIISLGELLCVLAVCAMVLALTEDLHSEIEMQWGYTDQWRSVSEQEASLRNSGWNNS